MILIICQNRRIARSLSETFHYMSILSYAATPHEALSEVSPIYHAALIINPTSFPDIVDFVGRLKSYKRDIPVFALTESEIPFHYADIFDGIFPNQTFTPALARKIIGYANKNNRARIGGYYLAGLDASNTTVGAYYYNTKLNFTKTESNILRYLIRTYPIPQKAESILKYAFKPSRVPEAASIRTHISLMNKKLLTYTGKKMIYLEPGKGYFIFTPEYAYKQKQVKSTSI